MRAAHNCWQNGMSLNLISMLVFIRLPIGQETDKFNQRVHISQPHPYFLSFPVALGSISAVKGKADGVAQVVRAPV
jgi:hypothetical protein